MKYKIDIDLRSATLSEHQSLIAYLDGITDAEEKDMKHYPTKKQMDSDENPAYPEYHTWGSFKLPNKKDKKNEIRDALFNFADSSAAKSIPGHIMVHECNHDKPCSCGFFERYEWGTGGGEG